MKSLKLKILTNIIAIVFIVALSIGSVSALLSYNSTMDTLNKTMTETAIVSADLVSAELNNYMTIAKEIGCIPRLSDESVSQDIKNITIDGRKKTYDMADLTIANMVGKAKFYGANELIDVSEREYFKASIKDECFVFKSNNK